MQFYKMCDKQSQFQIDLYHQTMYGLKIAQNFSNLQCIVTNEIFQQINQINKYLKTPTIITIHLAKPNYKSFKALPLFIGQNVDYQINFKFQNNYILNNSHIDTASKTDWFYFVNKRVTLNFSLQSTANWFQLYLRNKNIIFNNFLSCNKSIIQNCNKSIIQKLQKSQTSIMSINTSISLILFSISFALNRYLIQINHRKSSSNLSISREFVVGSGGRSVHQKA
eukprot:TRINITY_DN364_c0_g1_i3.p2 TRINITY_DN364_c0_g1~~TRINITY_DN364_c0_g1_i3.p2  ORF type:complete len:224 (+),score=-12.42 TRINITY_DN364_c0_g1_i3:473-1144(+)